MSFVWHFNIACTACGVVNELDPCATVLCAECGNDVTSEGKTVRDTLTAAYGDDWQRRISHIAEVVNTYRTGDNDWLVFNHARANDVHGYDDVMSVANYRVLRDSWQGNDAYEQAYRGPWSNVDSIALAMDAAAPCDVVDVIEALDNYPVLDDDEYNIVEQEMIAEHWESYGRDDMLTAVADALGIVRDALTDYARQTIETLTFSGYIVGQHGECYPEVVDVSYVNFHNDDVASWVKEYVSTSIGVDDTVPMRRWSDDPNPLMVDTRYESWVSAD